MPATGPDKRAQHNLFLAAAIQQCPAIARITSIRNSYKFVDDAVRPAVRRR
jgi:hypothetical protein